MDKQSLKHKTAGALLWNLFDRIGQQILLFVVAIIVANRLDVEDYTLVGMLAIFGAVANIILDSGFGAALIQKKNTTQQDFNSVFWFNIIASIILYLLLVGCSPAIARFFSQPKLVMLSLVVFLALPINSLTIIHTTILNREIRFNILARINMLSMLFSGIISLVMAYCNAGVWTLALQPVTLAGFRAILLWIKNDWRPAYSFSFASIKSLFGFASSLLFASLINTIFLNIYSVLIGKLFPAKQLGYYTQSNKMSDMATSMLYGSIQNATFPILSSIQDDKDRLIRAFRKTTRFTSFVTYPVMGGIIIVARPVIEILLKEEWWPSIPFLQLLCLGGCFTVLTAINNNYLKSSGKTTMILRIEYAKILFTIVCVLLTYNQSVITIIVGLVITRIMIFVVSMFSISQYTGYTLGMQLADQAPYILITLVMYVFISPMGWWINNNLLLLLSQILSGVILYLGISYLSGSKIVKELFELIFRK